ncbi:MAG: hypothetical protein MSB11_09620 [Prevotella sp.]|nr:hypothetical protein [Prevotella sp.]
MKRMRNQYGSSTSSLTFFILFLFGKVRYCTDYAWSGEYRSYMQQEST